MTDVAENAERGPCSAANCKCCVMWSTNLSTIHAPYNGKKVLSEISRDATCKSKNVVYALSCPRCDMVYVGETKQTLASRVSAHRRNIEGRKEDTHLVNHFTSAHGQIVMPNVRIIETLPENGTDKLRKEAETKWILTLNTAHPWGLNTNVIGYGALTVETDPADRRKCPWFTVKTQRLIPRGYKHKHKKKAAGERVKDHDSTVKCLQVYTDLVHNLKAKYRFLSGLKRSELQRLCRLAEVMADPATYRVYQELSSYALSRFKQETESPKEDTVYLLHQHVNYASNILRPERLIGRNKALAGIDPKPKMPKVVITRVLPRTVGSMVINYSQFLKSLTMQDILEYEHLNCSCADSTHSDGYHGHIVTGKMDVVSDPALRRTLEKGSSYRIVEDLRVSTAKQKCMETVMSYIHFQLYRKHRIDAKKCSDIYSKCLAQAKELESKASSIMRKRKVQDSDNSKKIMPKIRDLQQEYIIVPVDKAANNYAFVCKKFYVGTLNKELGMKIQGNDVRPEGNGVYKPVLLDAELIVNRHAEITKRFTGVDLSDENRVIPVLWATVKFHKNPIKYRFIAGAKRSSMKQLAVYLTKILICIKEQWDRYLKTVSERTGIKMNWTIDSSSQVVHLLKTRRLPENNKITVADFSTLYTAFEHNDIINNLSQLVGRLFKEEGKYISVGRKAYFHSDAKRKCVKWGRDDIIELITLVIGNSYVTYGQQLFHQTCGIPMGSNSSPVIANLCLSYMEFKYLHNRQNAGPARQLSNSVRYIDDIATFGTHVLKEVYRDIYPDTLPLSFDDTNDGTGHFLDLFIDRNRESKSITLYDKRVDFDFEVIRFPFKGSNQPMNVGLNVLYAQVIRIARICGAKDEFLSNLALLCDILEKRGYSEAEISQTLRKVFFFFFIRLFPQQICI